MVKDNIVYKKNPIIDNKPLKVKNKYAEFNESNRIEIFYLFIYFISFYLPHNNYKKYRKSRKKEVAWRPFKQNL